MHRFNRNDNNRQDGAGKTLSQRADQLFKSRSDPSVGNPKATVTIVKFFDYQCPYCRRMAQQLAKLNKEDPDVRIVYKEFPVFGPVSTLAARAAVGAMRQGKYEEFHLALMGIRGAPSERTIFRMAERIGLDVGRLRADMNSATPQRLFQRNRQLERVRHRQNQKGIPKGRMIQAMSWVKGARSQKFPHAPVLRGHSSYELG